MNNDRKLFAHPEPPGRNLPGPSFVPGGVQVDPERAGWYAQEAEPEQRAVPLTHYFWIVKRHRWRIAALVLASVIVTYIVSKRLTPIYESTATVDVDRRMPTGVVGQEANSMAVG